MRKFYALLASGTLALTMACSNQRANETEQGRRPSSSPSATDQQVTTNQQSAALNPDDRSFLETAAVGGKAEVELARLAQQKAQNEQVKQFAQRLQQDHSQANTELLSMSEKMSLTLPTQLDNQHKQHREHLSKLSGAKFDREYIKMMVDDHQKNVDDFQKQSGNAINSDVKNFASKTLPVLQQHLDMAKNIQGNLK